MKFFLRKALIPVIIIFAKQKVCLALLIIFLIAGSLIVWRINVGSFLNSVKSNIYQSSLFWASIGRILPKPEDNITETTEVEPVFEAEEINKGEDSTVLEETPSEHVLAGSLVDIQEQIDDISEKIDVLNQKVGELIKESTKQEEMIEKETEKIEEEEVKEEEEIIKEGEDEEEEAEEEEIIKVGQEVGQSFCEKNSGELPLQNSVIINEIAWMGSANSANDEWLEIKNISNQEADLANWQILSQSDNIKFIFPKGANLLSEGILLLERTNDDSAPEVKADFIYTGALKNNDEMIYLFDSNCLLQDKVGTQGDWLAGQNDSKRTMERKGDFSWQTSLNPGGTPKRENSEGFFIPLIAGGGAAPPPAKPIYPKILISEIQTSPIEERFIELYNPNDENLNLTGWYIQRKTETGASWSSLISSTYFEGKAINSYGHFFAASSTEADIFLELTLTENNSLVLKNPNREIVDKVGWGNAQDFETATTSNPETGKSIGRKWSTTTENYIDTENNQNDFEIQNPTPGAQNQSPQPENQPPQAIFTFSPQTPFVDDEIFFDASSSTDPDGTTSSFFWDFGDNSSTTRDLATTTHIFQPFGEFLITLEVTDERGATSSATSSIDIAKMPQAILEISTTSFSFKGEQEENIADQALVIENEGDKDLNWEITVSQDWLILSSASGTVTVFSSSTIEISANTLNLASGNYVATATIEAEDCENCPQEISVDLAIFPKTAKTVVINEIAWMGNETSSANEWLELYNNTDSEIDLTDWQILKNGEDFITIATSTAKLLNIATISANGYYLLERTDDDTVEDILADLIYTGSLNNTGEKLELKDNFGNLMDLVDCSNNWFSGDNSTKQTMERIESAISGSDFDNWQNSQEPGGTPRNTTSTTFGNLSP